MHDQRADLTDWLAERGIDLGATGYAKASARIKETADRSGAVSDEQLHSIVDEVVSGMEVLDEVAASFK
jgi:isopropylmalate/homocitrate/citramalate synthase